jgi:hypothetical protein
MLLLIMTDENGNLAYSKDKSLNKNIAKNDRNRNCKCYFYYVYDENYPSVETRNVRPAFLPGRG